MTVEPAIPGAPQSDEKAEVQWALRSEDGLTCRASEHVARGAVAEGGYTIGVSRSPVVAVLTRASAEGEWQVFADKVAFRCGPRCDHGDAPHLYLGAIDPDRCASCAAWPSLPCAMHRESEPGECSCGRDDRTDPHTFSPGCDAWESDITTPPGEAVSP